MEVHIESVDDLADQTAIEYGTMHGGLTMTFFENSRYQTYQRMWNLMHSKQPSAFVKSTEEGIARVLNSNYAFLLESIMYYRKRNCNLTQIGCLLDTMEFDLAILRMQEDNHLEILMRKLWDGKRERRTIVPKVRPEPLLTALFLCDAVFSTDPAHDLGSGDTGFFDSPEDYAGSLVLAGYSGPGESSTDDDIIAVSSDKQLSALGINLLFSTTTQAGSLSTFSRPVLSHLRNLQANLSYQGKVEKVNCVIETGITVREMFVQVQPLMLPATKVILSNVPPFITDEFLSRELSRHGKLVSPMKKMLSGWKRGTP
ncbi:hypothetical protein NHX12_008519 [Muraenolepis orangiensis]|uniref:Ionotropic glutamate receptor C-terminal domain-containing protein n=1 Tax=Muraenolepis orangiensis TaxID=630683 RepID=A0A9Q0DJV4_9TELE|nr:hypothetical protein NHX12_008519 [Muraenolepis orangiensis]